MKKRRSTNINGKELVQDISKRMCTEVCKACGRFKKRELQMVHSPGVIGCTGLDHILLQESLIYSLHQGGLTKYI